MKMTRYKLITGPQDYNIEDCNRKELEHATQMYIYDTSQLLCNQWGTIFPT